MNMMYLLADQPVNEFWAAVVPVARIVMVVMMALLAVAVIILIFLQLENTDKNTAITGNTDSYYSMNKGGSKQGRVTRLIVIAASVIAVLAILYFLSYLFNV